MKATREPDTTRRSDGDRLDLVAIACTGFAALAATDLTPLRDPIASTAAAYGALFGALALTARSLAGWPLTLGSLGLLALLGALGAPAELALAAGVALLLPLARRHGRPDTFRVSGTVALAALCTGSLLRTFDPLVVDEWLHGLLVAPLLPHVTDHVHATVSPSVYGLLILPVGIAGVAASGAHRLLKLAGAAALLVAVFQSRLAESPWPLALTATFAPAILAGLAGEAREASRRARTVRTAAWSALVGAALLCGFLATSTRDEEHEAPLVGFVTVMHGTFDALPLPEVQPKDPAAPPRFGQFRLLLEDQGARTVDVASREDLEDGRYDALVTINFSGDDALDLVEPMRELVRGGTDLLVLADHTDMFGQMETTNALLADTGVELRFDSAVPQGLGTGWVGSVRAGRDPLFGPHRTGRSFAWGVGCSLEVAPPARTLASGTRAFIDDGDRQKAGGLGNLGRDHGETYGGYALAASSALGDGRVLAFGDTSAVQDTALIEGRGFAGRLSRWLLGEARTTSDLPGNASLAHALLVLALGAAALAGLRASHVAAAVLAMGLGETWFEARMDGAVEPVRPGGLQLAVVGDHATGVPLDAQRIDAMLELAASRGWRLTVTEDGETPAEGAVALIDPWAALDDGEARALVEYVERGGSLVLFLGERGARSTARVLDDLGLSLGIPLGYGAESAWEGSLASLEGRPAFYESHEIRGPGLERAEILASCFGRPVATGRLGEGRWLLVADGGCVQSKHVEMRKGGSHRGRLTLQRLLDVVIDGIG